MITIPNRVNSMTEVFVAPPQTRDEKRYHTDKDCHAIPSKPQTRTLERLVDYEECIYCAGEYEGPKNQDHSYQQLEGLWADD